MWRGAACPEGLDSALTDTKVSAADATKTLLPSHARGSGLHALPLEILVFTPCSLEVLVFKICSLGFLVFTTCSFQVLFFTACS